jgi:hypothetical protein|tara:strand:+ start:355 stop:540 length:186 start_codon:yes stop_codon:yes gene_type:complete
MKFFSKARLLIKGYKTYGAVLALILTQVFAVTNGEQTIGEVINWVLTGGGLAALRASMPTK